MTSPLDVVREALATTPRDRESLDLGDPSGWTPEERAGVARALLDAAQAGDHRVPAALWTAIPAAQLPAALEGLLTARWPRVRVEAGFELLNLRRQSLRDALDDAIRDGQLDRYGLQRAAQLLLACGDEAGLRQLLSETTHEDVRTVLIEALWGARQYALFPSVWWSGLGLLRRTLSLPLASFRGPALARFTQLLQSDPVVEGYTPASGAIPAALRAAMDDVDHGSGPVPAALVAALSDEGRQALTVYAADVALHRDVARGVVYVGALAGTAHRDLLEWAAAHPRPAYAQAGRAALAALP